MAATMQTEAIGDTVVRTLENASDDLLYVLADMDAHVDGVYLERDEDGTVRLITSGSMVSSGMLLRIVDLLRGDDARTAGIAARIRQIRVGEVPAPAPKRPDPATCPRCGGVTAVRGESCGEC